MRWSPGERTRDFTQRLARRHALVGSYAGPIPRVVARARGWTRQARAQTLHVSARLELVLRTAAKASAPEANRALLPPLRPTTLRTPAAHGRRESYARTAERVVARGLRIDRLGERAHHTMPGTRPAPATVSLPAAIPVQRVLRREREPDVTASTPPVRAEPRFTVSRAAGSVGAPLSSAEVERVADQVMQTMDRRLAAFRERRGRS